MPKSNGKVQYPPDHKPGMRVPKGGSDCSKCEYYEGDNKCGNEYFQKWNGSDVIPAPPNEYCSDWFEPNKVAGLFSPGSHAGLVSVGARTK